MAPEIVQSNGRPLPPPPRRRMMMDMASQTRPGGAEEFHSSLRVVMMPRDTNNYGTIFGGVILSYIDQAGFIEARRHGMHRWVTASIDRVDFHAPVHTGDVVSFLTATISTGTTSVKVRVRVEAERYDSGDIVNVTEAQMTMVAVDASGKPIPFRSNPTVHVGKTGGAGGAGGAQGAGGAGPGRS
jgi:acyl-CoA thioesterase YciA